MYNGGEDALEDGEGILEEEERVVQKLRLEGWLGVVCARERSGVFW